MSVEAFPLHWPAGWPRATERTRGRFSRKERQYYSGGTGSYLRSRQMTIAEGVERTLAELGRFGVRREDIVISSNVRTRNDGLPRSGAAEPDDPGVAVYWTLNGERQCMAIDGYDRAADNLAALAATIESMRAIERHGGAQILRRAFQGFKQLGNGGAGSPDPELTLTMAARIVADACRQAFSATEVERSASDAKEALRLAMRRTHPDTEGGNAEAYQRVMAAREVINAAHGL